MASTRPEQDSGQNLTGGASDAASFGAPAIRLPTGGGAIHGIGEKFGANPVTGTGTMTVPIVTTRGRSDFGPRLSLSYDSGAGNGPFGFGWSLSLPSITRKTDKGLPRYHDSEESDVFILSGAEDLVPELSDSSGEWTRVSGSRSVDGIEYVVDRYRPRIEGLFARIERWTEIGNAANVCWRSISRDNVTTWYGRHAESRVADPADSSRIFSWLVCETYDDRGNAAVYRYKSEDASNIAVAALAHERNRTDVGRSAARYLKRIQYGNQTPHTPGEDLWARNDWMFEAVFDYGEHYAEDQDGHPLLVSLGEAQPWAVRADPFSTYRAGFDVRTYRLCRRVLMFHHFRDELGVDDYLVRSTSFRFTEKGNGSFLTDVEQAGFVRNADGTYLKRSFPPLEFEYSQVSVAAEVREVDPTSVVNLSISVGDRPHRWLDLDGEGVPSVLTEHDAAWYYTRNVSPLTFHHADGKPSATAAFDAVIEVTTLPSIGSGAAPQHQFFDLAGNGRLDCVVLDQPAAGFFERTEEQGWESFTPLRLQPNVDWTSPHVRFIDLTGDGRPDIAVTEDAVLTWYPSRAAAGFGPAERVSTAFDEEQGPAVVFGDADLSIFVADMAGDGLADIVRIRNGEVCYWPNLGYGQFGAKVSMDNAPWFDAPDLFDSRRIRLADIDGSGTTDLVYIGSDGVRLYFNQSGNAWSDAALLDLSPPVDDVASIEVLDLLGSGTACLVWTSPLPGTSGRTMRYVDLMGGQKPHLLVATANNLGAETRIAYAPSTKFFLADKLAGHPWITRLPFPVHVVERVESVDRISGNRFVTRTAYHHGYFDPDEREFRGFGMVETWDTDEFAVLAGGEPLVAATNLDTASNVPPVLTRTWFHTGIFAGRDRVSNMFAGLVDADDAGEYYREPGLDDADAKRLLLDDTVLPPNLTAAEQREACRALTGAMLRQEVYALDGSAREPHPYSVTEQNFAIRRVQPRAGQRHAVFFSHSSESLAYHYERVPADPRTTHALTLAVDDYGNVTASATVAYPRRQPDLALERRDRDLQGRLSVVYSEHLFTNAIDSPDAKRTPQPAESQTFELSGVDVADGRMRLMPADLLAAAATAATIPYEEVPAANIVQKRTISHTRALYRRDDLTGPLSPGQLEPLALPFESYSLALTPGLVSSIFGAKVSDTTLADECRYVHSQGDDQWWIPSGRVFYSASETDTASEERAAAATGFFLARRFTDPFGATTTVRYDAHNLLVEETRDAIGNTITVGERDVDGNVVESGIDYRSVQAWLVTDENGNRSGVSFDALGFVVGAAVMGKRGASPREGDLLDGFEANLSEGSLAASLANPHAVLMRATARIVHDLFAFARTREQPQPSPCGVYSIVRVTHDAELAPGTQPALQQSVSYSDGFGREIQKKVQAEPGPVIGGSDVEHRWVATGSTIFNNKGAPVRHYEPFFSGTPEFEPDVRAGASALTFYDPTGRVIATLYPNHTWTKVQIGPWVRESWDVNDTALVADPKTDPDLGDFFRRVPEAEYLPTWYAQRESGALGAAEQDAAAKTVLHAGTPSVAHADPLGRTFLTIGHNRYERDGSLVEERYATRVARDIDDHEREIVDANDRLVARFTYDLTGTRIHQAGMDSGERSVLNNVAGNAVRAFDSRGHEFRAAYDALQRITDSFLRESGWPERLIARRRYGETLANPQVANLRGKVVHCFDQAGLVTTDEYDFKHNLRTTRRQLAASYQGVLDWSANPAFEPAAFTTRTTYDALNRPVSVTAADQSIYYPTYNEANLVRRIDVRLAGAQVATTFVANIDYDAKGQRLRVSYGNGVTTEYGREPLTFRLASVTTSRASTTTRLQDLKYTYDAGGNITHIDDAAQQTLFFDNQSVAADTDYTYDALYRLIAASGREHIGQASQPATSWDDRFHTNLPSPTDGQAMRRYSEQYDYDAVGNFLQVVHRATQGNWTRAYTYDQPSLLEPAKNGNRLGRTTIGVSDEPYTYDTHGNMTGLPHLSRIGWDHRDQLHATSRQVVVDGPAEVTYQVYDANGDRVRQVTERADGTRKSERIYLDAYEVYREYDASGVNVLVERETRHVMSDRGRVALVERRTAGSDGPALLVRYQFDNHVGSASLELDDAAQLISYEEYFPYGSTSYQATRNLTSPKRYRYLAMEHDESTGFIRLGVRYYAPWLGVWTSADTVHSGVNLYAYAKLNPVMLRDTTGNAPDGCEEEGSRDAGICVPFAARTADDRTAYWVSEDELHEGLDRILTGIVVGIVVAVVVIVPVLVPEVAAYEAGLDAAELITGKSTGLHLGNLLTGNIDSGRDLSTGERVLAGVGTVLGPIGLKEPSVRGLEEATAQEARGLTAEAKAARAEVKAGEKAEQGVAKEGQATSQAKANEAANAKATTAEAKEGAQEAEAATKAKPTTEAKTQAPKAKSSSAKPKTVKPPKPKKTPSPRWKVGDPIDAPINGREPSWSAVKQRYWKNRAAKALPDEFTPANLERMKKGLAPIDRFSGQSMELEHVVTQRSGLPGRHLSVMEVTPLEHAFFDKFRVGVRDLEGKLWRWSHLDPR